MLKSLCRRPAEAGEMLLERGESAIPEQVRRLCQWEAYFKELFTQHGTLPFPQRILFMCRHLWMRYAIIFDSCIKTNPLKKKASQWELTKRASTPWAHSSIELSAKCVQARPSQLIEVYWFFSLFPRRGGQTKGLLF